MLKVNYTIELHKTENNIKDDIMRTNEINLEDNNRFIKWLHDMLDDVGPVRINFMEEHN